MKGWTFLIFGVILLATPLIRCDGDADEKQEPIGNKPYSDDDNIVRVNLKDNSASEIADMIKKMAQQQNNPEQGGPPSDIPDGDENIVEEKGEDADVEDEKEPEEENDVLVLSEDNFDEVINDKEIILVEFYAPWCGHCKALTPKYEAAAKRLKENDPPVALAKVDATVHTGLGTRFSVSGYPTLKFFKNGKDYDYDGPREEDGIVSYMEERAKPDWKPPPDAVITLTTENFHDEVNKHELILVEFYAPWCGHCKKLAPEYEKAAKILKENDPPIPLAKVDATAETELGTEFEVTGYPTLKMFRKGKPYEYKGGRDQHGIVDWMKKQVGEASKEIKNEKDLKAAFKVDDITIVGFFDNEEDQLFSTYMDAANEMREDFDFLHTFDEASRNKYKVNPGSIVVFQAERFHTKYENKYDIFDKEDGSVADIQSFIQDHKIPLVGELTYHSKAKRYGEARPLVILFYTVDWSFAHRDATQNWRKKFARVAKEFKEDFTFVIADEDNQKQSFRDFGLEESGEELNIGILGVKDTKYAMPEMEEYDHDHIMEFLQSFKDGKAKRFIKSAAAPKKQGVVKTVVGNTFNKWVTDSKKDVLIEFYAPWCGHCKKLEPEYKKMAKELKSDKNLVIAKMDATANDFPEDFEVTGFPTIYFIPAVGKTPVKHEGANEVDKLKEFMTEHASVSFGKSAKDEL